MFFPENWMFSENSNFYCSICFQKMGATLIVCFLPFSFVFGELSLFETPDVAPTFYDYKAAVLDYEGKRGRKLVFHSQVGSQPASLKQLSVTREREVRRTLHSEKMTLLASSQALSWRPQKELERDKS